MAIEFKKDKLVSADEAPLLSPDAGTDQSPEALLQLILTVRDPKTPRLVALIGLIDLEASIQTSNVNNSVLASLHGLLIEELDRILPEGVSDVSFVAPHPGGMRWSCTYLATILTNQSGTPITFKYLGLTGDKLPCEDAGQLSFLLTDRGMVLLPGGQWVSDEQLCGKQKVDDSLVEHRRVIGTLVGKIVEHKNKVDGV